MADLFANFEINREPKWPVLLQLTVGSLLLHVLMVALVVYVPAFRDALNIANLLAGTRFVDKDYTATKIGDEVQLLELANGKFHYPEGYFAMDLNQGSELGSGSGAFDPFAPKIISQAQNEKPVPSPSPNPTESPLPSPSPAASPSPTVMAENASDLDKNKNTNLTPDQAQKELEETAKKNDLELPDENQINKKALRDFANYANDLKTQGKLDIDKPFEIVIEGELGKDGKLTNAKVSKKAGDPNLVDLFSRMVAALNDSGLLVYLKPLNQDNPGAKVIFTIKQGENEVLASVESEASSPDNARVLAKTFNAALFFGAKSRSGKDEEILMKNTTATQDGKKVVVNFSMPRQSVVDLIKKQLAAPA